MNKQPIPKPGKEGITQLVIADLLEREKRGIAKYGRTLETHNGRNALVDAYEEALDLAQYLKQEILERESLNSYAIRNCFEVANSMTGGIGPLCDNHAGVINP